MASTPLFRGQTRGRLRVGAGRGLAAGIADKTDLALAGNAGLMRQFGDPRGLGDVLASGLREPSNISEVKPLSSASGIPRRCSRGRDGRRRERTRFRRDAGTSCPAPAAACAPRQDGPACRITGSAFGLGGGHIGAHVLPAEQTRPATA
jgi:hypothetical protein